ncbi:MAG: ATP-binding cassette domain-containing protein, partial [Pseudomonadota bacterium]
HCDTLRGFLGSAAVMPLFDAPWSPIFLLACFLLHPWLGWVALSAFVLLCVVCLGNEALTRERTKRSQAALKESARFSQGLRGKADAIRAMGFRPALTAVSQQRLDSGLLHWLAASGRQLRLSALARVLRLALQIVVLATGAWLVVDAAMSPGAMIAASILVTRALAPVEQLIGSWPQTLAAIKAYRSLRTGLDQLEPAYPAPLPVPDGVINVEKLIYAHPGQTAEPLLRNLTFSLDAGESLAIIGPSGSGKSTLARLLVGLLKPSSGSIRLDAISVSDWPEEQRGRYTGYLPQDIQLISGTVAQNIARFAPVTYATQVEELTQDQSVNTQEAELFSSARLAGAHDAICRMPEGYNTPIGPGGLAISGGEQQLVGLARAIYGPVRFVVLDEPNANQDRAGENALLATLASLKQRGVTTILIAHRPAMLKHVDKVLVLQDGIITQYGPRDAVLQNLRG